MLLVLFAIVVLALIASTQSEHDKAQNGGPSRKELLVILGVLVLVVLLGKLMAWWLFQA